MTREEAKAEIKQSILSSWEQHFEQDAKDAIERIEMLIDRIYDEFQGDFKEPMELICKADKIVKEEFVRFETSLELMRKADKIVKEALASPARAQVARRCY